MKLLFRSSKKAKFATIKIDLDKDCPLYVTCLHLNHRSEPRRLEETDAIRKHLDKVFVDDECQIWTGDFNAVTQEDYSIEKWEHITEVRRENRWELPKTELTSKVN